MFKLNCKKYGAVIEAYKKMENIFEEEKEYLLGEIQKSAESMDGGAVNAWKTGYLDFFEKGLFNGALEQLRGIRSAMEIAQPLVNRIAAEGQLFAEQLDANEMLFPYSGELPGEEWIQLEEAYVGNVKRGCDQVQDIRKRLEGTMEELRGKCSGIVEIGAELVQFEETVIALRRVKTFRRAFDKYVFDIRELDNGLCLDFNALVDWDGLERGKELESTLYELSGFLRTKELKDILAKDPLCWTEEEKRIASEAWTGAVEKRDTETLNLLLDACRDKESGRVDYHLMSVLREYTEGESREILSALMEEEENLPEWTYAEYLIDVMEEDGCLTIIITQDVLLEKDNRITVTSDRAGVVCRRPSEISCARPRYDEDYYKTAAELLEKDGEGRYAFESLLRQDAGEIGEREKEILSLLYQDKCRTVETSPGREGREGQFEVAERFVEGMSRYQINMQDRQCRGHVYMDEEWNAAMTSYMKDDDSLANQILLELSGYKERKESGWRRTVQGENASVSAVILPHKTGLTLELKFRQTDLRTVPEQTSTYISTEGRDAWYVGTLNQDIRDRLDLLGYDQKEIINAYLLAGSVADEDFIDYVIKAEYSDAFRMDPEELGDRVKLVLPDYASRLYKITDMTGKYTEMENFINAVLYQDEDAQKGYYHVEDYLKLMVEQSELLQMAEMVRVSAGEGDREESRHIMIMDCLWKSLYNCYTTFDISVALSGENLWYSEGDCMYQVRNLTIDGTDGVHFGLALCRGKGDMQTIYHENTISTRWVDESYITQIKDEMGDVREVNLRLETLWQEQLAEALVGLLTLRCPEVVAGIRMVSAMEDRKMSDALKNATNLKCIKEYQTKVEKAGIDSAICFIEYFEKKEALEAEKDKIVRSSLIPWFYSGAVYQVDGNDEIYLSEGINNYDIMVAVEQWNREGCTTFLDLKEMAKGSKNETYKSESEEELKRDIVDWINKQEKLNEEQKEAMVFMVGGRTEETKYESVLEIDEELFMDCADKLNGLIERALELNSNISIRNDWTEMLRGK